MKNLIIIGARGFGREIYNLAKQTKEHNVEWTIKGFLDDKKIALDEFTGYPQIISSVEDYEVHEDDVFICALGAVDQNKKYINLILEKGGKFINIIHPSVDINMNVKLGIGIIIFHFSYIGNDSTIGNFTTIKSHVAIGHDVIIGDYCQINALTFIGGFAKIGTETIVYPGANIAPKKRIGNNVIIGINSSVLNTIQDHYSVYGNPAKRIL